MSEHSAEKVARIARMLRLPAADQRVSHLHMRAVAALIEQWEEDDAEGDDYTRAEAAEDLRLVIATACTCRALPHDRRCPTRVIPPMCCDLAEEAGVACESHPWAMSCSCGGQCPDCAPPPFTPNPECVSCGGVGCPDCAQPRPTPPVVTAAPAQPQPPTPQPVRGVREGGRG